MVNELANRLLIEVEKRSKELSRLQNALKKLSSTETLDAPRKVEEAVKALEGADPKSFGVDIDFAELLESTAADQQQRANRRRVEFGRMLKEKAEEQGLSCTMIGSEPMTFSLPPFTLAVDLDRNIARIEYARLTLEELPAIPDQITAAYEKKLKLLEKGWSSEQFFDALHDAYQMGLFDKKSRQGERLNLADLIPYVALAFQGDKFRSDPVAENYQPYGRARMAYDFSRLRRNGLLQRNGWRVNLGAATGSSTQNKKGVLYIEENPGQGQYYLTVWFTPAG